MLNTRHAPELLRQARLANPAVWGGTVAFDGCTLRSENRGCTDCPAPMRYTGKLPRTSLANRSPTTVSSFPRARPATEVGQSIRAPREFGRSPRPISYPQKCQGPSRPTGSWHFFLRPSSCFRISCRALSANPLPNVRLKSETERDRQLAHQTPVASPLARP